MRILLIEDDPMIGQGLRRSLEDAGMSVDWVRDGQMGAEAITVGDYAIVLLDLGLPGRDGTEILRTVRGSGDKTPVLVITARDELDDRIASLDLGADDYLAKPFDLRELMARIRAVVRRHAGQAASVIGNGEIEIDLASHELTYRGQTQILPAREFALMHALLKRPGTILSRTQLEESIYGWGDEVESNAIDVLIHYVRRKFDKDIIYNVRGAGWMVAKGKA
ncbi:response regulator transcription factor [Kaistia dalseonensis]|uniref:DNA-binding response OmpR family regulator n=1 Tax=Kaistia dalseonensis TaxID=410840 RepID=A0ABU0H315_9HYPH|nr:response regulator transcription factor [Kaistia dalseonensis]MCX5493309.1 response regulator transcription factor [Kaistia dalseonensis]MDQ0435866.1 DNA-binding response OmpR family regulator [Kaistia dalseonensis]